jgi:diguanylate cyclase (GGDEF)-like protein
VTDPLTGAANRRTLDARVRALAADGIPFAIAIADLDHFKRINDEYGHDAGDRTLRTFAEAMRRTLRPDDLVARFGGDEFVMVIANCDARQAANALERVRREFARGLDLAQLPTASASFGVADSSVGRTMSSVLGVADSALLEAKREGRDRVQVAATPIDLRADA